MTRAFDELQQATVENVDNRLKKNNVPLRSLTEGAEELERVLTSIKCWLY